ncbi:MAG: hypothetical protein RQ826_13595 [Xanthomonadales bacterium]|nr:hypothetical protein [Xanthomonadales bacterium]
MSSVAKHIREEPVPRRPGFVLGHQHSKLLPSLFQWLDVGQRLNVLNIGPALPETVDFFADAKCRLHFSDLFGERFVREEQQSWSEAELRNAFEDCLSFPAGTRLDLCFFWDFLCYLDDAALRAFDAALRPWLHAGTRAHGFGVHHMAIRLENRHYGIVRSDTLSLRERRFAAMTQHPHSQGEMQDLFGGFHFERGVLLADGKLELLMKSASRPDIGTAAR